MDNLNRMPAATWNKLAINSTSYSFENIELNKEYKGLYTELKLREDELFIDVVTGVGAEFDELVKKNTNKKISIVMDSNNNNGSLKFNFDNNNNLLIDDIRIKVLKAVEAQLIVSYEGNVASKHYGTLKIDLEEGASLKLIVLQNMKDSDHLMGIASNSKESSKFECIRVDLGANKIRSSVVCNLVGKKASFALDTIYYADGDDDYDYNDVSNHYAKATESNILANGALFDRASKAYRGTIFFDRGCKSSIGKEEENILLFSDDIVNKSAPIILCSEEEVQGEHAASIGRIDDGLLFYLKSRGLSDDDVRLMMIESSFMPILDKIFDTELRDKIYDLLMSYIR